MSGMVLQKLNKVCTEKKIKLIIEDELIGIIYLSSISSVFVYTDTTDSDIELVIARFA